MTSLSTLCCRFYQRLSSRALRMLFRCEDGTCSGAAGQRCATQPSSAMSTRVEDEDQGACALRFRCLPMLPLAPCSLGICPPPPVSFSRARALSLSYALSAGASASRCGADSLSVLLLLLLPLSLSLILSPPLSFFCWCRCAHIWSGFAHSASKETYLLAKEAYFS